MMPFQIWKMLIDPLLKIFIDIVTIDDSGKTDQVFKHDISHAELENLIHQIKSGRGLILDADA